MCIPMAARQLLDLHLQEYFGYKSRMRGQCFGFTFGFMRKKFHGNVMALIELIGQKSRSE